MDRQKIINSISVLREYNQWRRGLVKESPNASLVGESIDYLVDLITIQILNKQ